MSNFKFVPVLLIAFFVVLIFGIISSVGLKVENNDNLNADSKVYIQSIVSEVDQNYQVDSLKEVESNLSINGTGEGLDPFERQYLESKGAGESKLPSIDLLKKVPDIVILSFGLSQEEVSFFYDWFKRAVAFILIIVGFVLIFGPGRAE